MANEPEKGQVEKNQETLLARIKGRPESKIMLFALEMQYATSNARGELGPGGLKETLAQFKEQGLIKYVKQKMGPDYITTVVAQ